MLAVASAALLSAGGAHATDVSGQAGDAGRFVVAQAATPQPMNAAPAGATSSKARSKGAGEPAADGGMNKRVEQLEEQLVDMQVTVGTLESLSRGGGGGSSARNGGGSVGAGDAARVESLETQVRSLAAEVQRLNTEIKRLGGAGAGSSAASTPARGGYADAAGTSGTYIPPSASGRNSEPAPSFGSTTVTPSAPAGDPIGSLIGGSAAAGGGGGGTQMAAIPPAGGGNAKQDYEAAYGHLLRQDYGAAEAAFEEFLKTHPSDPLAGNAQYWLGETHFVRGAYKPAAAAFLKGYQNFSKSNKAPDSLLKLAMSLDRLGQKDAACSSFGELVGKFPDAPSHVKTRAASEQKRLGCR